MTNSISGSHQKEGEISAQVSFMLTEEEEVHRQLVRDVMSRLDYDDVKLNAAHNRKRDGEVHEAHCADENKSTLFIPVSDRIKAKIKNTLLELKATEQNGTLRMKQINARLAEFGEAKTGEDAKVIQ